MEIFALTILSVLAFIGLTYLASSIFSSAKIKMSNMGYKLIIYVPEHSCSGLECLVRQLYLDRIPERLMTDGKVYLMIPEGETEAYRIATALKKVYPLEVLPVANNILYDIKEGY